MTQDQVNSYIRTLCTVLGTLSAAGLGITAEQIGVIQSGLLGIAALGFFAYSLYGTWKANSVKGVAKAASAIPNTTIVTGPELAAATPGQPNIVSNTDVKVVPK